MLVAGDGRGLTAYRALGQVVTSVQLAAWAEGCAVQHLVGLDLQEVIHIERLIGEGISASILPRAEQSLRRPAQGLGMSPVKCSSWHHLYRLLDQAPLKDLPSVFVDHRLLQHMPGNCNPTTPQLV